jgi:hypothetical protein
MADLRSKTKFMNTNFKKQEAVIDLHEKGFTDDFQFVGKDLLWVQGKTYVQSGEFSVLESHRFVTKNKGIIQSGLILGIQSLHHNAKGILIQHSASKRSAEVNNITTNDLFPKAYPSHIQASPFIG